MAWLQKACSGQELEDINSYVCGLPPFPGFQVPSYGLDKDKPCTATELSNIFRLLPVALLLTPKSVQKVFLEPIQGEDGFFVFPLSDLQPPACTWHAFAGQRGGGGI